MSSKKKLGVARAAITSDVEKARSKAASDCGSLYEHRIGPQSSACRTGVDAFESHLLKSMTGEEGSLAGIKVVRGGKTLGYFSECAFPCKTGFERVPVRLPRTLSPQDRGICVCRLGPDYRKKKRGQAVVPESEWRTRKPFGKWQVPIHLRRCIEVDRKGRCVDEGTAGLTPRDIGPKEKQRF